MRMGKSYGGEIAFTRKELVVVMGTVTVLLVVGALSLTDSRMVSRRKQCTMNLKQVGLAFRMFGGGCGDRYPFKLQLGATNPQTGINISGNTTTAQSWMHFQALSNELATPKVLLCPADRARVGNAAADFTLGPKSLGATNHRDLSISYFVALEADETKPQCFLSGDRNIAPFPNVPAYSSHATGAVYVTGPPVWTTVPNERLHGPSGNICLADGSVQSASVDRLQEQFKMSANAYGTNANLILFPQ